MASSKSVVLAERAWRERIEKILEQILHEMAELKEMLEEEYEEDENGHNSSER